MPTRRQMQAVRRTQLIHNGVLTAGGRSRSIPLPPGGTPHAASQDHRSPSLSCSRRRSRRPDRQPRQRVKPSRGAVDGARSDGRQHRRLRLHGRRRHRFADASSPTGSRSRTPPAGRTSTGSTTAPRTTSTSTTPATASTTSATGSSSTPRSANPNSFLYALPGVVVDRRPEAQHHPDVRRRTRRATATAASSADAIAHDVPVGAEQRRARRRFPNYAAVAAQAIRTLSGGGKVFAGQVDDPFFVDLGTTFDAINIRKGTGNPGRRKDDLAGYNVHSSCCRSRSPTVTRDGKRVGERQGGQRRGRRVVEHRAAPPGTAGAPAPGRRRRVKRRRTVKAKSRGAHRG